MLFTIEKTIGSIFLEVELGDRRRVYRASVIEFKNT